MPTSAVVRLRLRHALRCAFGGALLATIGLLTHLTQGCVTSVLFLISTVAGAPHNYQGFQLRASSLTLVGTALGSAFYLFVSAIALHSTIATFFLAIPFIAFLSALRADAKLMPMPVVANVFLGLLLISRFGDPRHRLIPNFLAALLEAALAWLVAVFVNLIFPDRAGDLGRHIVAAELRKLGATISAVATKTFSRPCLAGRNDHNLLSRNQSAARQNSSHHFSIFLEPSQNANTIRSGLLADDYIFLTSNLQPSRLRRDEISLHREELVDAAEASLSLIHDLRPFGRTRVRDYAEMARAAQMFEASKYEPRILPESQSRWRNVAEWKNVIVNVRGLINKVSSLESIVQMAPESPARFSEELIVKFFGEAYLPLWVSHFASCAAACSKMASLMCNATCRDLFSLPQDSSESEESSGALHKSQDLHQTINPRRWKSRRSEMYLGFLLRYRLGLLEYYRENSNSNKPKESNEQNSSQDSAEPNDQTHTPNMEQAPRNEKPIRSGIRHSKSLADVKDHQTGVLPPTAEPVRRNTKEYQTRTSEKQALSYFAITGHALSEEIAHVQESMTTLASSSDARGVLAPFYFLVSGFPEFWQRIKTIRSGNLSSWEVRFVITHTMLLSSILGIALFLPLREKFEASELAWVFTSAALAAQLSAEPTLFIGSIRVVATVCGTAFAFAFSSLLDAMGRSSQPALQFLTIPYLFITTMTTLMLFHSYRYAVFLFLVTNNIMFFCPRSSPTCSALFQERNTECFPTWKYAVSRSVNVSVGVLFAVFFHLMFWPRFANQVALWKLSHAFLNASRLYGKLHRTYFSYGSRSKDEKAASSMAINPETTDANEDMKDLYFEDEAFVKEVTMVQEVQTKVGEPLASAMLTANSEADVWRRGPFRLYPLIPRVLSDFVALNVSLGEMAAVLGRQPIYAPSYGRSVFQHYILPMIAAYETIEISLNNLTATTCRAVTETQMEEIKQDIFDLHQAIMHLAQTRGRLRKDAEKRGLEFKKLSAMALSHAQQTSSPSSTQESLPQIFTPEKPSSDRRKRQLFRSLSDSHKLVGMPSRNEPRLCVDDVVLYNAFTFITDGCLSAFVRIAATVVVELEFQLKDMYEKKKRKKSKPKREWVSKLNAKFAIRSAGKDIEDEGKEDSDADSSGAVLPS